MTRARLRRIRIRSIIITLIIEFGGGKKSGRGVRMMRREEERVRWEVVAGVAEGDLLTTMSAFGSTTSSQSRITKNKLIDLNSRYSGKIEKANPLVA